jgi:hypothetical protein
MARNPNGTEQNGSDFEPWLEIRTILFRCVPVRLNVWISNHGSKSEPFRIRTTFDHSKSELVRISDDDCTCDPLRFDLLLFFAAVEAEVGLVLLLPLSALSAVLAVLANDKTGRAGSG